MTDGQVKPEVTLTPGGATFTQEQLDAIVKDRLARERGKYADYDDLKGKLSALEQEKLDRMEAEKTERQKEIDAARKDERTKAGTEYGAQLNRAKLDAAIERELLKAGADPDGKLLMVGELEVKTPEEVNDKVAALLKAKPFLVQKAGIQALGVGGTPQKDAGALASGMLRVTSARVQELTASRKWVGSEEQKAYEAGRLEVTD